MLWMMECAGKKNSNIKKKTILARSADAAAQQTHGFMKRRGYPAESRLLHFIPVEAGFVSKRHHWKYSSSLDYAGGKGLLRIDLV